MRVEVVSKHINYHSSERPREDARESIDDQVAQSLFDLLDLVPSTAPFHLDDGKPVIVMAVMLAYAWNESDYLPKHELSRRRNHWGFQTFRMFIDGDRYLKITDDQWRVSLRWFTLSALSQYAEKLDLNPEPLRRAFEAAGPEPTPHCFGVGEPPKKKTPRNKK